MALLSLRCVSAHRKYTEAARIIVESQGGSEGEAIGTLDPAQGNSDRDDNGEVWVNAGRRGLIQGLVNNKRRLQLVFQEIITISPFIGDEDVWTIPIHFFSESCADIRSEETEPNFDCPTIRP